MTSVFSCEPDWLIPLFLRKEVSLPYFIHGGRLWQLYWYRVTPISLSRADCTRDGQEFRTGVRRALCLPMLVVSMVRAIGWQSSVLFTEEQGTWEGEGEGDP